MTGAEEVSDQPDLIKIDPRDQLVLDEAQRGIDQQKKDLEGLRSRAGATIGYATVVMSVIGSIVLRDSAKMSCLTWIGLILFGLAAVMSVSVLAPRTLTFGLDATKIDARIDRGDSISMLMRASSAGLIKSHASNEKVLKRMHRAYLTSDPDPREAQHARSAAATGPP